LPAWISSYQRRRGRMADGPVVLAILGSREQGRRWAPGCTCRPDQRRGFLAARLLILELAGAMVSLPARGIPAVTLAIKRAGAEIPASAVEMPPEELVTLIYEAMALELQVVGVGDWL